MHRRDGSFALQLRRLLVRVALLRLRSRSLPEAKILRCFVRHDGVICSKFPLAIYIIYDIMRLEEPSAYEMQGALLRNRTGQVPGH